MWEVSSIAKVKGSENLVPLNKRTKDEQRKIGKKGGEASGKARRKKKALKETMQMLLELPVYDNKAYNKMSGFGIDISDIDNNTRLMYSLLQKAFMGDVAAIKEVRSIIGEDVNADVMDKLDELIEGIKENADS